MAVNIPERWLLFTTGRGPGECELALQGLIKIFQQEAEQANVCSEVVSVTDGESGPSSVLFALEGLQSAQLATNWTGTIKWICSSPIRKGWPRKNWFVSCTETSLPQGTNQFKTQDLHFESLRASGPGGQHVNKTESAIRLTHIPTGVSVLAQEERSQYRNKSLAIARLKQELERLNQKAQNQSKQKNWQNHNDLERGNACRIYKGLDFKRV